MRTSLTHQDLTFGARASVSGRFVRIERCSIRRDGLAFSCSVSKKVFSRAVDRNRARRRVRAAFLECASGHAGGYMIHVKKPAIDAESTLLKREIAELLIKLQARS